MKRKDYFRNILLERSRWKVLPGRSQGRSTAGQILAHMGAMELSSALRCEQQEAEREYTLPQPAVMRRGDPTRREGRRNELMFGI
jgi:hypothetical protein